MRKTTYIRDGFNVTYMVLADNLSNVKKTNEKKKELFFDKTVRMMIIVVLAYLVLITMTGHTIYMSILMTWNYQRMIFARFARY